MKLCVLSSGSQNGNCFVVCAGPMKILIDCGISPRAIRHKLRFLGIEDGGWRGAFLTHGHTDHCQYASEFWLATGVTPQRLEEREIRQFVSDGQTLSVTAYDCPHGETSSAVYRVVDPITGWSVMVATDLTGMTDEAKSVADSSSIIALESNYDPLLLEACGRDEKLKARSRDSHLSNQAAAGLSFRFRKCRELVLVHLSRQCNSPELVRQAFDLHWLDGTRITVAWEDPVMVAVGE